MSNHKDPSFIFSSVNVPWRRAEINFSILLPISSKGGDHFKRTDDLVYQSIWAWFLYLAFRSQADYFAISSLRVADT